MWVYSLTSNKGSRTEEAPALPALDLHFLPYEQIKHLYKSIPNVKYFTKTSKEKYLFFVFSNLTASQ